MARDWPAQGRRAADRADRRSAPPPRGGRHLPALRRAGARHPRTAPRPADRARPRRDRRGAGEARRRDHATISTSCARAQRVRDDHQGRAEGDPRRVRDAAQDRDRRRRRRPRGRGPDPARGHGGDRHPCRLDQARAARHLPGAAARRQGPRRHGDEGRGFRHPRLRRQHAHAGAVLLLARAGLQGEGLAAAAGRAAGARQGADQPPAARATASASPRSCRCPRTRRAGRRST